MLLHILGKKPAATEVLKAIVHVLPLPEGIKMIILL